MSELPLKSKVKTRLKQNSSSYSRNIQRLTKRGKLASQTFMSAGTLTAIGDSTVSPISVLFTTEKKGDEHGLLLDFAPRSRMAHTHNTNQKKPTKKPQSKKGGGKHGSDISSKIGLPRRSFIRSVIKKKKWEAYGPTGR